VTIPTWSARMIAPDQDHAGAPRRRGRLDVEVTVPDGVTAEVDLPDGTKQVVSGGTHRLSGAQVPDDLLLRGASGPPPGVPRPPQGY
jgi:hypothetical protein